MVFDYKNNLKEALENGIVVKENDAYKIRMTSKNNVVEKSIFRNFPSIRFQEKSIVADCIFEDCGEIYLYEAAVKDCTFHRIDTVFFTESLVANCHFADMACDSGEMLLAIEQTILSGCSFDGVELTNGSYLCDGTNDCKIKNCEFTNISTDRKDRQIINCEETEGVIFKQKVAYSIVDEDTCVGLDDVTLI